MTPYLSIGNKFARLNVKAAVNVPWRYWKKSRSNDFVSLPTAALVPSINDDARTYIEETTKDSTETLPQVGTVSKAITPLHLEPTFHFSIQQRSKSWHDLITEEH